MEAIHIMSFIDSQSYCSADAMKDVQAFHMFILLFFSFPILHTRTKDFKRRSLNVTLCFFSSYFVGWLPFIVDLIVDFSLQLSSTSIPSHFTAGFLPQFFMSIIYLLHAIFSVQSPSTRPPALNH